MFGCFRFIHPVVFLSYTARSLSHSFAFHSSILIPTAPRGDESDPYPVFPLSSFFHTSEPSTQHPVPFQSPLSKLSHRKPYIITLVVHIHSRETHEANSPDTQPPRHFVQQTSRPRARRQAPPVLYLHLQHHQHPRRLHFLISHT